MANLNTIPEHVKQVQTMIEKWKPQIMEMLPKHMPPERMIRLARSMVVNNQKLALCTPLSLATALTECSLLGLEPNTPLGLAWVIPFKDQATLIVGYQGYIQLMYNTGFVKGVYAEPVYEADLDDGLFDYDLGSQAFVKHRKSRNPNRETSKLVYAWARATVQGSEVLTVLTAGEVLKHKKASFAARSGDKDCPWNNDWEPQMWTKTAIRAIGHLIPKSREIGDVHLLDSRDQGHAGGGRLIVEDLVADTEGATAPAPNQRPATQAPAARPVTPSSPTAPAPQQPAAANKRPPGRPRKDQAAPPPPPPPAEDTEIPPDEEPIPFPDTDVPPDDDQETESPANRELRAKYLEALEGFRLKCKDGELIQSLYANGGYKNPDEPANEPDLNKLGEFVEMFGAEVALAAQRSAKPKPAPSTATDMLEVDPDQLREMGAEFVSGQLGAGIHVRIPSIKVVSMKPLVIKAPNGQGKDRQLTKLQLHTEGQSPIDAMYYAAAPDWLNIGILVKCEVEIMKSAKAPYEPFYKIHKIDGIF